MVLLRLNLYLETMEPRVECVCMECKYFRNEILCMRMQVQMKIERNFICKSENLNSSKTSEQKLSCIIAHAQIDTESHSKYSEYNKNIASVARRSF